MAESVTLDVTSQNFSQGDTTAAITKDATRNTRLETFKDDINTAFTNIDNDKLDDDGGTAKGIHWTHATAASATIDFGDGNSQARAMPSAQTIDFTGSEASKLCECLLVITAGNTYTPSWAAKCTFLTNGGSAPSTYTATEVFYCFTVDNSTTVYVSHLGAG